MIELKNCLFSNGAVLAEEGMYFGQFYYQYLKKTASIKESEYKFESFTEKKLSEDLYQYTCRTILSQDGTRMVYLTTSNSRSGSIENGRKDTSMRPLQKITDIY
jgi:hypothetical protein